MPNYVGIGYDGTGGNFVDIPVVDLGEGPGWPGPPPLHPNTKFMSFPESCYLLFLKTCRERVHEH